jgi:hypothetical protein
LRARSHQGREFVTFAAEAAVAAVHSEEAAADYHFRLSAVAAENRSVEEAEAVTWDQSALRCRKFPSRRPFPSFLLAAVVSAAEAE